MTVKISTLKVLNVFKATLLVTLLGCVPQSSNIDYGVSERADFSVRRQHFAEMSTRELCQIAIDLERTGLGQRSFFTHAPFWFIDGEVVPAADQSLIHSTINSRPDNEDVSMAELQHRYMRMRVATCPLLENRTVRDASRIDRNCVEAAQAISTEELCTGLYDGKPFSVALSDAHATAAQRSAQQSRVPIRSGGSSRLNCRSTTDLLGTVTTTCY